MGQVSGRLTTVDARALVGPTGIDTFFDKPSSPAQTSTETHLVCSSLRELEARNDGNPKETQVREYIRSSSLRGTRAKALLTELEIAAVSDELPFDPRAKTKRETLRLMKSTLESYRSSIATTEELLRALDALDGEFRAYRHELESRNRSSPLLDREISRARDAIQAFRDVMSGDAVLAIPDEETGKLGFVMMGGRVVGSFLENMRGCGTEEGKSGIALSSPIDSCSSDAELQVILGRPKAVLGLSALRTLQRGLKRTAP